MQQGYPELNFIGLSVKKNKLILGFGYEQNKHTKQEPKAFKAIQKSLL